MRTSGARFPDPSDGDDMTPKRYNVDLVVVQTLTFEVDAYDEEQAEEHARELY